MSVLTPLSFSVPGQKNTVFCYKRAHSLQNHQRNILFRLSYQFVQLFYLVTRPHKRSKDTLSNKSPGFARNLPNHSSWMSLFSKIIQDCIYCSHERLFLICLNNIMISCFGCVLVNYFPAIFLWSNDLRVSEFLHWSFPKSCSINC